MAEEDGHTTHFTLSDPVYLLFSRVILDDNKDFAFASIIFCLITVTYHTVKCKRMKVMERKEAPSPGITKLFSISHMLETSLYMLEVIISYLVMLAVMTFNTWMLIAVVTGSVIGYNICTHFHQHKNENDLHNAIMMSHDHHGQPQISQAPAICINKPNDSSSESDTDMCNQMVTSKSGVTITTDIGQSTDTLVKTSSYPDIGYELKVVQDNALYAVGGGSPVHTTYF